MTTEITTLIENHGGEHKTLHIEHGISFLIKHKGATLLFDSGQSGEFIFNAGTLNEDLRTVDHVVLSHGHYDHTNGFPFFVRDVSKDFSLHVNRDFFDVKWASNGRSVTYLGPSWDKDWLKENSVSLELVEGDGYELVPGVHIVTNFLQTNPLEVKNPRFVVERPGSEELEIDDFRDEVSVVIETEKGLVIVVGCSHPGIMNMLDTIRSRFDQPIYAVLGGTHLVEAQGERLKKALSYLENGSIGRLGLSHCTGDEAMDALERDSDVFYRNVTGTSLIV